ncbi:MAG: hypothetical protein AAF268_06505, partial [Cyanobacteria bacterium P01_A01_bin.3]
MFVLINTKQLTLHPCTADRSHPSIYRSYQLFKTTVWTHRLFTSFLSLSISTSPNFQAFATDRVGKTRCRLQQFVS